MPHVSGARGWAFARLKIAGYQFIGGNAFLPVSKWLGHSIFTLTLDIYGDHCPREVRQPSAQRLSSFSARIRSEVRSSVSTLGLRATMSSMYASPSDPPPALGFGSRAWRGGLTVCPQRGVKGRSASSPAVVSQRKDLTLIDQWRARQKLCQQVLTGEGNESPEKPQRRQSVTVARRITSSARFSTVSQRLHSYAGARDVVWDLKVRTAIPRRG
jgi:hypothetical protein